MIVHESLRNVRDGRRRRRNPGGRALRARHASRCYDQPKPAAFAKQAAYDQLAKVSQECGSANWDSEGADAVEQNTVQNAYLFLEALPPGYPLPDILAEPDGHLNLEWYRGTRRILSVSVSPEGTLYWAALIGTEDPRGSCLFSGDIPDTILYWIRRVSAG
jgi:hypothetical protein